MTGFRWHPAAKVIGPDGLAVGPALLGDLVIADRPGGAALALALARGSGFRIGGDAPLGAGPGTFETLTGGSTGAPRRILRNVASWTGSFAVNAGLFGIGPGVRVAVAGRLSHSLALYGALEGMHLGAEVHLLDGLRPDRAAMALRERGVAVIYATPAQLRMIVDAGADWPGVARVIVGGSKLDPVLRAALGRVAPGAHVTEFYGAAETSFITIADDDTPEGSVGRAYPGVEIDLRDRVIRVRSPYLFSGYVGDAGGAVWKDGWLSVGEMGRMEAGYLYLSGRAGRMVTIADQNVFPEEIETFLAGLPGVVHVAVIPRADAARGHVIEAVMQGDPAQTAAIMAAARARLGPLVAPRAIRWVAEWPLLPSGKTDLAALI
jgi:long-chain acyl-CoA synthetase